jgi:hypothetical protein
VATRKARSFEEHTCCGRTDWLISNVSPRTDALLITYCPRRQLVWFLLHQTIGGALKSNGNISMRKITRACNMLALFVFAQFVIVMITAISLIHPWVH